MTAQKIRVLFNAWAEENDVNSQSTTAREIALRLDPDRFESTFFYADKPDARFVGRDGARLLRVPPRFGSLFIAGEMLSGSYDILFYPDGGRATRLYYPLARIFSRRKKVVAPIEGSADQILSISRPIRENYLSAVRQADRTVACSESVALTLLSQLGIQADVIHLGVDTSYYSSVDRTSRLGPVTILFVGSIQPRKQVHLLLNLASSLANRQVCIKIIGDVVGDPAYRALLIDRVRQEGLTNVEFLGGLSRDRVRHQMHTSDIFLLPSRLEGMPKVTLEAASTGLPCIIFDDYHTPSVIDGITGFQVKTFEEMVERARFLIENPEARLKMGAAATQHVLQFDWGPITRRWESVFEDLVVGRSR